MRTLIIILNYRGLEVLLPCLASVSKVVAPEDAVLVIDNGQEGALMNRVRQEFPQVEILTLETNGGFASGMNMGLRLALTRGFAAAWILNNDTVVDALSLSQLKQAARHQKGTHLFSPVIRRPDQTVWFAGGYPSFWRMRTVHCYAEGRSKLSFETGFLTGCALFIPRETLVRVGLLDEQYFLYYEDLDYSLRVLKQGGKLYVVPSATVIHHEASEKNPAKAYWLVRSGVTCFLQHTPQWLLPWTYGYLVLRRVKNWVRFLWDRPLARLIEKAYTDALHQK